jgi:hypothetical protein
MRDPMMHLNLDISDQEVQIVHSEDLDPITIIKMLAAVQNKLLNDHYPADKDEIILDVAKMLGHGDKPKEPKAYKPDDDFSAKGIF